MLSYDQYMHVKRYVRLTATYDAPKESNIFRPMGDDASSFFLGEFVYNHVKISLPLSEFRSNQELSSFWRVTSIQHNSENREIVATIEA